MSLFNDTLCQLRERLITKEQRNKNLYPFLDLNIFSTSKDWNNFGTNALEQTSKHF